MISMITMAFSIAAIPSILAILAAYLKWKDACEWREIAAKQQDEAAKARMDAEEAKIWLADEKDRRKALENRLELAKTSERDAIKRENAAKYARKAEQDKCEELRRMLAETREMLDSERRERENIEREIRNIMNYDGTADGQEDLA